MNSLLTTASSVWEFLQEHGGLDLQNYDQDLASELFETLDPTARDSNTSDLDSLLVSGEIGVEEFLVAFFRMVQPFSDMMSDLMRLFEKAGIQHGKENLQVCFNFDEQRPPLDFDLKSFRQWQEIWQRVAGNYLANLWSYQKLWAVNEVVRHTNPQVHSPEVRAWVEQYRGNDFYPARFPEIEPPAPKSGHADLDKTLKQVWHLWLTVVRESKRHGPERKQLEQRWRENRHRQSQAADADGVSQGEASDYHWQAEEYRDLWPLELLGLLDNDLWAVSLAQGAYATAETIRDLPEPHRDMKATALNQKLTAIYESLRVAEVSGEWLQQSLIEFLSLPVWKRRHDLYSAWIMTQILASLSNEYVEIHSVDGRLLFEFKPTHLATVTSRQPHLHLMAEVRSALANPLGSGRKNSIQPDYSLIPSPITSPECSLLEVECKQYLKAAKKKFAHALRDYARGRPRAQIILVNYGPASDSILDEVEADVRDRTRILGAMRPRSEAAQHTFARWVREAIPVTPTPPSAIKTNMRTLQSHTDGTGEIRLAWKAAPRDLDLHLVIKTGEDTTNISYSSKGDALSAPWVQLDHDDQKSHGNETIQIAKWLKATYLCRVHNYSGETPLAGSGAMLTFVVGDHHMEFICPSEGTGQWWEVFSYASSDDKLVIANRITDSLNE